MPKISPKFDRAVKRYEADGQVTSNEAKNLRSIAYDDAHHDTNFDPKNAVAYAKVFDKLAGMRSDKATTTAYLKNAAVEFKYLDEDRRAGPALEKAFRAAAKKSPELAEILDRNTTFDSGSVFGSPNAKVQHYVRIDNVKFTHGWEYYAEKVAELLKKDPSLAEFKDIINTVVFQGYGPYKIPDPLVSGDLKVPKMNGALKVPGATGVIADVLAKVSKQGKVLMGDAHEVLHVVIWDGAKAFSSKEAAQRHLDGIEQMLPFAAHKEIEQALEEAREATQTSLRTFSAKPAVDALVAANKKKGPYADLVAKNAVFLGPSNSITIHVKKETADPGVLEKAIREALAKDPAWKKLGVEVNVLRKYD